MVDRLNMSTPPRSRRSSAHILIWSCAAACLLAGAFAVAGCTQSEQDAFRGAASDALKSGMTGVATGIIDGGVAVFNLGASSSGSTATGS